MSRDLARVRRVKNLYERQLLSLDGVQGVAIGEDHGLPLIKVYVDNNGQSRRESIPKSLENVPVVVEEAGTFEAY